MENTRKNVRKNIDPNELENELWQLNFTELSAIYARLVCEKYERGDLIKELLKRANREYLEMEIAWYKLV